VSLSVQELMLEIPLYRRLSQEDRSHLSAVSQAVSFDGGEEIFREGDESRCIYTVARGRVKVYKLTPDGRVVILEILGSGDPVGAVAVYEELPYPATAVAMEPTICVCIPKQDFFSLLEEHPSLVRGLLLAMTHRLMVLTHRLSDWTGGRVETRFARLFLKLSQDLGTPQGSGTFIPMTLSRQELADLLGTTVETSIRIMSRWGKEGIVTTEKKGFQVADPKALEVLALG
jgi:CRP/FNR family transcriptional regulator